MSDQQDYGLDGSYEISGRAFMFDGDITVTKDMLEGEVLIDGLEARIFGRINDLDLIAGEIPVRFGAAALLVVDFPNSVVYHLLAGVDILAGEGDFSGEYRAIVSEVPKDAMSNASTEDLMGKIIEHYRENGAINSTQASFRLYQ